MAPPYILPAMQPGCMSPTPCMSYRHAVFATWQIIQLSQHTPHGSPTHFSKPSSTPLLVWCTGEVLPCITPHGARTTSPAASRDTQQAGIGVTKCRCLQLSLPYWPRRHDAAPALSAASLLPAPQIIQPAEVSLLTLLPNNIQTNLLDKLLSQFQPQGPHSNC